MANIVKFILPILLLTTAYAVSNYIPQTGCWTYPDKIVCIEPSQVNATVWVKNVTCYSVDQYGTGSWSNPPCIADAQIKPVNVMVCYKMLPMENGQPDIQGYTKNYNCHEETWSGDALLYIPQGIMPWKCSMHQVDNYTKECNIKVNSNYVISGVGNDVNGTKAIIVTSINKIVDYKMYAAIAIVVIIVLYWLYKRRS